jgi:hypothetical protein
MCKSKSKYNKSKYIIYPKSKNYPKKYTKIQKLNCKNFGDDKLD